MTVPPSHVRRRPIPRHPLQTLCLRCDFAGGFLKVPVVRSIFHDNYQGCLLQTLCLRCDSAGSFLKVPVVRASFSVNFQGGLLQTLCLRCDLAGSVLKYPVFRLVFNENYQGRAVMAPIPDSSGLRGGIIKRCGCPLRGSPEISNSTRPPWLEMGASASSRKIRRRRRSLLALPRRIGSSRPRLP